MYSHASNEEFPLRNIVHSAIPLVFLLTATSTQAQSTCTLSNTPPVTQSKPVTTYTYVLSCPPPAAGAGAAPTSVTLSVNSAFLPVSFADGSGLIDNSSTGQGVILGIQDATKSTYTFQIGAQSNLSTTSTMAPYTIVFLAAGAKTTTTISGMITVPQFQTPDQLTGLAPVASDESIVDVLLGVGSHVTFSNYPDYITSTNSVLTATGVGQAIPEMLVGAGFTTGASRINATCSPRTAGAAVPALCLRKLGKQLVPSSIFANVQVPLGSVSTSGTINGYTFGGGYKIQRFVEILIGFSLSGYNQPSPGFINAAAAVVSANAALPASQQVPLYLRYNATDILNDKPYALDGFPLLQQEQSGAAGGQIYAGNALISHYRGGLFIGLAYPVSLNKLFQH